MLSSSLHEEWRADPFRFLISRRQGVFVVRLFENRVVDHVVAVDFVRRLVYDGEEEYPLRSSVDVLKMCGGPRSKNFQGREIRQVLDQ